MAETRPCLNEKFASGGFEVCTARPLANGILTRHLRRNNKGRIPHPGWPGRHIVGAECLNYTDRVKFRCHQTDLELYKHTRGKKPKKKDWNPHRVSQTSYQSEDCVSVEFSQQPCSKTCNFLFHLCTFSLVFRYPLLQYDSPSHTHSRTRRQWRPWGREGKGRSEKSRSCINSDFEDTRTFDLRPELLYFLTVPSLFLVKRVRKLFETYVCSLRVSGSLRVLWKMLNFKKNMILIGDFVSFIDFK